MDKVILIEKHKISLIDSKTNGIKWKINVPDNITGTYRLDKYISFTLTIGWENIIPQLLILIQEIFTGKTKS